MPPNIGKTKQTNKKKKTHKKILGTRVFFYIFDDAQNLILSIVFHSLLGN